MKNVTKFVAMGVLVSLLAACGGGSDDRYDPKPPTGPTLSFFETVKRLVGLSDETSEPISLENVKDPQQDESSEPAPVN